MNLPICTCCQLLSWWQNCGRWDGWNVACSQEPNPSYLPWARHSPTLFLYDQVYHDPPVHALVLQEVSSLDFTTSSHLPFVHYMQHQSHHPNILWRIQIIEHLIMQFSPATYNFIPLWSTYSPLQPIFRYP